MGVYLLEQHGVNPSVMLCLYCQKEKGIVLLGRLRGDAEAPRQAVFDREPCEECMGRMKMGVILISVKDDSDLENPYRTGGWCVVKDAFVKRAVKTKELLDDILKQRAAFIPDAVWDKLGLPKVS